MCQPLLSHRPFCGPPLWWRPLPVPPDLDSTQRPTISKSCLAFWLPVMLSQWAVLPERQGTVGLGLCPPLLGGVAAPSPGRSQLLPGSSFHPALYVQVLEAAGCLVPPAPVAQVPSWGQRRAPRHLLLLPLPGLLLCKKSPATLL